MAEKKLILPKGFRAPKTDSASIVKARKKGYKKARAVTKALSYADPKTRKKMAGPRATPRLQSAAYASKKKSAEKAAAKKKAATRARLAKGSGPKSNPIVRSSAYYARKRAAAKKK